MSRAAEFMSGTLVTLLHLLPLLAGTGLGMTPDGGVAPYHGERRPVALSGVERRVLSAFDGQFHMAGQAAPALDPLLVLASRSVAEALAFDGDTIPVSELLRASLEHAGVTDTLTFPFTLRVSARDMPEPVVARLLASHVLGRGVTHLGIGASETLDETGARVVTVVFVRRVTTLSPVERAYEVGDVAPLSGVVSDDTGFPTVLVMGPDGHVSTVDTYAAEGRGFWSTIALDQGPGDYVVELLAGDRFGPQVVNLFPLHVGVAVPRLPVVRLLPPDPEDTDTTELERRLARMLNRARREQGLRELRPLRALSSAAREHSLDMARGDYFGHLSPGAGRASDRVARHGVRARVVGEVISIAPSTAQAHANLLRSPSHRRTLFDPRMTHVGVGVVPVGEGASLRLVITEQLAALR